MKLVWLFDEHRVAVARVAELEQQAAILVERYENVLADNKRLTESVLALNAHVQANPSHLAGMVDVFNKYQEHVLSDRPFKDNVIPDDMWLTGTDVPVREDQ
jgi:hypothetical protein